MTNIKVTVEYEVPKTNKFDALLAEYALVKQIADETESYYKPLADIAEEAKFDAIMGQLESIKYYAKQISMLQGGRYMVKIVALVNEQEKMKYDKYARGSFFEVIYNPDMLEFDFMWHGNGFTKKRLKSCRSAFCEGGYNILGRWDDWKIYQKLEANAIEKLRELIDKQKQRGQEQINRFNNIQGDM